MCFLNTSEKLTESNSFLAISLCSSGAGRDHIPHLQQSWKSGMVFVIERTHSLWISSYIKWSHSYIFNAKILFHTHHTHFFAKICQCWHRWHLQVLQFTIFITYFFCIFFVVCLSLGGLSLVRTMILAFRLTINSEISDKVQG